MTTLYAPGAPGGCHRLRAWWRPGLPILTLEGDLLVPDTGPEAKRQQIQAIWDGLRAGNFSEDIPQADRQLILFQCQAWLQAHGLSAS